jgi:hypothetical protein
VGNQPFAPQERFAVVFPPAATPGSLAVAVPESRLEELRRLEQERVSRTWRVRGIVSDHVPLVGGIPEVLARPPRHRLFLNQSPLSIYLHHGGNNAVYYDFVGDGTGFLQYVEVRVDAELPSSAFLYARQPLNEMLDAMSRTPPQMPLALQRLELVSPIDGVGILAYELILPFDAGVRVGPLGGIWQWPQFAPYDAVFREAITSASPFYRLLCAFRVYDGVTWIRRWTREQCAARGVQDRMPGDPVVDVAELRTLGFDPNFLIGIRTAADLFNKLRDLRDAIAHFLIEGEQGQSHTYLASGEAVHSYSLGATILLRYAARAIDELRVFCSRHLEAHMFRGSILPTPEIRDRFNVHRPNG